MTIFPPQFPSAPRAHAPCARAPRARRPDAAARAPPRAYRHVGLHSLRLLSRGVVLCRAAAQIFRLIKLLRMFRLMRVITRWENDSTSGSSGAIRMGKFVMLIFLMAHIAACIWMGVAELERVECAKIGSGDDGDDGNDDDDEEEDGDLWAEYDACGGARTAFRGNSWIVRWAEATSGSRYSDDGSALPSRVNRARPIPGLGRRYVVALYWALMTLTTVGYGDVVPHTTLEIVWTCVVMFIGTCTFGYIIGNVTSLITHEDETAVLIRDKVRERASARGGDDAAHVM